MTNRSISQFGPIDYSVFSVVLFFSAAIGFYYAWNERKKKSLDHMLLGGRKLKVLRFSPFNPHDLLNLIIPI
jgi:hypothetical protein